MYYRPVGQYAAGFLLYSRLMRYPLASRVRWWLAWPVLVSVFGAAAAHAEGSRPPHQFGPVQGEALLFDQRRRIDQQLAALPARTEAEGHVFFIGFAGVAEERVFAEEIKLAATVVDARLDIGARRTLLLNDWRDTNAPLATVSGLLYTLQRIGERMNPAHDVLFLALSSHGSPDHQLAVENGDLPLAQLDAPTLARALAQAGIRSRVIVISACYAGGFIPALRSPDTVIITAAAADRASFGCSDDRDLTYFGEAFYRDALPGAASLQDAFERARRAIGVRERREHERASNPQAYFGERLSAALHLRPANPTVARTGTSPCVTPRCPGVH